MKISASLLMLVIVPLAWSHPGPGIVVDRTGQVYFVHTMRHRILKLDAAGKLTIFVQGGGADQLFAPHQLFLDGHDNLYSVGDRDGIVWRIAPDGTLARFYSPADANGIGCIGRWGDPFTLDSRGNLYAINSRVERYTQILRIESDGRLAVLAGGDYGRVDGVGDRARFGDLHGGCFAWSPDGSLYVTDSREYIRKITPAGAVTTLADPSHTPLRFKGARGLACDARGNLYVADAADRRIYRVTPTGILNRLAGSGEGGSNDGTAGAASFVEPTGVASAPSGSVYVLDYPDGNPRVREISERGAVTTVAAAPPD